MQKVGQVSRSSGRQRHTLGEHAIIAIMSDIASATILLVTDDDAAARHWAQVLQEYAQTRRCAPREMPDVLPAGIEIVVTDCPDWPAAGFPLPPGAGRAKLPSAADAGASLVRIGGSGPADVCLPSEFPPRELQTACRLLAQVARLKLQVRNRQELNHQLLRQALTDPLTGLPNRRAWDELVGPRLALPLPSTSRFCMAIVDLDHFKAINDTFGHPVGDEVLRMTANALRDSLRQGDLVARLGGDEFGLLLRLPNPTIAATVVQRVRTNVGAQTQRAGVPPLTASIGYCLAAPAADLSADSLLAAADEALRRAKQEGRNRVAGS